MRKGLKKLTALFCSAVLAAGSLPVAVLAADGDETEKRVVYTEDFEGDSIGSDIANQQNGWGVAADSDDDGYYGHFNVGDYSGDTGAASTVFRQAVTNWWKSAYSFLDLYNNGVYKLTKNGAEQAAAEAEVKEYLSGDMTISFKANFAVPNPKDCGEEYIRIKDENGNTLVGISAKRDEVKISDDDTDLSTGKIEINSILGGEKTAFSGLSFAEHNKKWYDIKVSVDKENLRVKVSIDNYTSDWLQIGNSENTAPAESIGMIKEIEFGIWSGAWWQSMYIDDVAIAEGISEDEPTDDPTGEPEKPEGVKYIEYFEGDSIGSDIANQQNGWRVAADSDDDGYYGHFNVGDYSEDTGAASNAFRQAVTNWWKSAYSFLNLYDNGVYKLTKNGAEQAAAEAEVKEYLSGDMTISFKANFAVPNPKDFGEDYIRIKDENGNTLVGISAKRDEVNAPDGGADLSTGKIEINGILGDGKTALSGLSFAEHNKKWYDIKVSVDKENLRVKVSIDNYTSDWLQIGNSDNTAPAENIGMIKEIEFGIWSGAWWQSMYIDDVAIAEGVSDDEPTDPGDDPEKPGTVSYIEDFEDNDDNGKKLNEIKSGEAGWSYDGNSDVDNDGKTHKDYANFWVGDNRSGSDNSLRFASETWFKTMWLNLDLKKNAVSKGISEADITNSLQNDMSLSFKVQFEIKGADPTQTHEQYIRVKGDRTNVITDLRVRNNTLYLKALNNDKTDDVLYEICKVNVSPKQDSDNQWIEENIDWHNVKININKEDNTYSLEFDGRVFDKTPWGVNIPAGTADDDDRTIGTVSTMEFGHWWSGWWQSMYLDDIAIGEKEEPVVHEWGVQDFNIDENGSFSLTVSSGNMLYYDTAVYAALYQNGRLCGIKKFDNPKFDENSLYSVQESFTMPEDKTDLSVKVFIWRSTTLRPIIDTVYEKTLSLS